MKKIIIAGGTGFLGTSLANHYSNQDTEIIILTRGKSKIRGGIQYESWDGKTIGSWIKVIDNSDIVINLNGKSVDCRYTKKNKSLIYSTRLESTNILGQAILQCNTPPKLWINSASATIYRHSVDKEMDEYTGEFGEGFSIDVCQKWEAAFNQFELKQTRKVILRTGIVLGKSGGPMKPLKMLAKLGFGGKQGSGEQYVSWLHEYDFVNIIDFIASNQDINGAYNITAPTPLPNSDFMKAIRQALKIRVGISMPRWLLELGAIITGTETELILKSRRVVPAKLLEAGYHFKFKEINKALFNLCG